MSLTLEGVPQEGVFELVTGTGAGQLITDIRVMDRDYLDYETEDRRTTTFTVGRLMSLSQMTYGGMVRFCLCEILFIHQSSYCVSTYELCILQHSVRHWLAVICFHKGS